MAREISVGRVWEDKRPGRTKPFQAVPNDPVTGRRCKSKTFAEPDEAHAWLTIRRRELLAFYQGGGVEVPRAEVTFEVQARVFYDGYRHVVEGTRRSMWNHIKQAAAFFGDRTISSFTRSDVDRYLVHVAKQGVAVNVQRARLLALREVLDTAVRDGHLTGNPAAGVSVRGKSVRSERHWLTTAEFEKLIVALDPVYKPIAIVARAAGLRIGEALGLRVRDVRPELNAHGLGRLVVAGQWSSVERCQVPRVKGGVTRALPLLPRAASALEPLLEGRFGDDLVFAGVNDTMFRKRWHEAVARTEIDVDPNARLVPHCLRKSFGQACRDAEFPDWALSAALRHADARTSSFYVREPTADDLDVWFSKLTL